MKTAAGVILIAGGKVLMLQRPDGTWGLPGGKCEEGETPLQAMVRETQEETAYNVDPEATPLQVAVSNNEDGFTFTCFSLDIDEEFVPVLTDEHTAFQWAEPHDPPTPLFMETGSFIARAFEAAFAQDAADTARRIDTNGWFEIKNNPISKVGVFPYLGKNIPGADPTRVYMVFRPAEELSDPETIESLKLLPWINDHAMLGKKGTIAAERKGVHGVLGQEIYFKPDTETLYGNIKLFSEQHAAVIDSGKIDLSLGYRCRYEYAPGVYKGQAYEYVQRLIRGNHVASVNSGRMGPEVAVLDHFSFTFDSKDVETMADEKTPAGAGEGGAGSDPTLEDCAKLFKALEPLLPMLSKLAAGGNAATPAAVVEAVDTDTPPDADKEKAAKAAGAAAAATDSEDGKKAAAAMDAMDAEIKGMPATVLKALAARDKLARKLTPHVGAFDHADMTPGEVVTYGLDKLKLKAPAGHELAFLTGYLDAKPAPGSRSHVAADVMDAADAGTAEAPAFITNYAKE